MALRFARVHHLTLTRTDGRKVTIDLDHVVTLDTNSAGNTTILMTEPENGASRTITVIEDQTAIAKAVRSRVL